MNFKTVDTGFYCNFVSCTVYREMKANSYDAAKQILSNYIEQNRCRKTPERFAVLEAAYSFASYFSIQELDDRLEKMNFPVSRATLYNTLKMLLGLHLVVCQRIQGGMRYKAGVTGDRCLQVCTVCGKVTEVKTPELADVLDGIRLKRFRKESFSVYIYGTCSTCQAMLTRQKRKENTNKKNKHLNEYGKR